MKLRAHLGAFLVCLGLVALWTWPLAGDPAHLVPDNTDPRLFSWVMISVFQAVAVRWARARSRSAWGSRTPGSGSS